ncbi:hypothetical protein [Nocardiopsis lambiniae]|uniref:VWA domain-containing protein n=1 Tax=Nocardiopsis lambiniae TaxID=3075539 RepID=A0ABU2MDY7_9ACTN|nr:hypothetical protein [Nocardiopsis sp. DSM 44743]MDT0330889.1 hypothetical protein [Nocardiopsis sp. DSM 44743]
MRSTLNPVPRHRPSLPSRMATPVVAGAVALSLSACSLLSDSPPPDQLQDDQALLVNCGDEPPATLVAIDGTGSSDDEAITVERLAAVEDITRQTAVCGGRLRVLLFSSSSGATTTLFDGALEAHGATPNARLRKVPELVEAAITEISEGYEAAIEGLPGGGSDVTAQYRLGAEHIAQLGDDYRLHLYVFTDGFHNVGHKPGDSALSQSEAEALAEETTVPNLAGASVTVAGIGRVAGDPVASDVVEGLVFYYDALCQQSKTKACTSVTDYTVGR